VKMSEREQLFQEAFGMSEKDFYRGINQGMVGIALATGNVRDPDLKGILRVYVCDELEKALKEDNSKKKEAILSLIKMGFLSPQKATTP